MTIEEFAATATEQTIKDWCAANPERMLPEPRAAYCGCLVATVAAELTGQSISVWETGILALGECLIYDHRLKRVVNAFDDIVYDRLRVPAREVAKLLWPEEGK